MDRVTAPNQVPPVPPAELPSTLGALRAAGHQYRTVKQELRDNLLARMGSGEDRFPGIVGYEDTVLPEVERALLAGHDMVLLGERGQGKTRLIRSLGALLDEWTPVIPGSVLNEHPMHPLTPASRALVDSAGDDLTIGWLHRSMRYGEKLATPDTSVGDLIGDVDPIRLAQGRTLGDPETIHFGLVPRTNRGVFAVNELPDLAERIQVALLNVLEERDIQVRGYQLRLPLDLLLVASANPEDYTNRGRIITPLKDRFGAEIRTHYPLDLDLELSLIRQEADLVAVVPEHVLEVLARFARDVRESPSVDPRSGVSARFAIAAAETVAAAALRRSGLLAGASAASGGGAGSASRPEAPVARIGDTDARTDGAFLLNHFTAAPDTDAEAVWRSVTGWYTMKTGVDNSTALRPVGPSPFALVNYARLPAGPLRFLAGQLTRPSFHRFVRATLDAHGMRALPVVHKLVHTSA